MTPTVVDLLAKSSQAELHVMQSTLERERARNDSERARIDAHGARIAFELEQISEALARQSRDVAEPQSERRPTRGATQKRILNAVANLPQPVSPAQIIEEMEANGPAGNKGTIHNAIGRLVKIGELHKPAMGQYQLASRNGSSGESHTGPSENGAEEPLSTAAQPQKALHE